MGSESIDTAKVLFRLSLPILAVVLGSSLILRLISLQLPGLLNAVVGVPIMLVISFSFSAWFRGAEYVGFDETSIELKTDDSLLIKRGDLLLLLPVGGTPNRHGLLILTRPWWQVPHLTTYVADSTLKALARSEYRVIGVSRRSLEFEEQTDRFFDQ